MYSESWKQTQFNKLFGASLGTSVVCSNFSLLGRSSDRGIGRYLLQIDGRTPIAHLVLDLGQDVLVALHIALDCTEIPDLDLPLELFRDRAARVVWVKIVVD